MILSVNVSSLQNDVNSSSTVHGTIGICTDNDANGYVVIDLALHCEQMIVDSRFPMYGFLYCFNCVNNESVRYRNNSWASHCRMSLNSLVLDSSLTNTLR